MNPSEKSSSSCCFLICALYLTPGILVTLLCEHELKLRNHSEILAMLWSTSKALTSCCAEVLLLGARCGASWKLVLEVLSVTLCYHVLIEGVYKVRIVQVLWECARNTFYFSQKSTLPVLVLVSFGLIWFWFPGQLFSLALYVW